MIKGVKGGDEFTVAADGTKFNLSDTKKVFKIIEGNNLSFQQGRAGKGRSRI